MVLLIRSRLSGADLLSDMARPSSLSRVSSVYPREDLAHKTGKKKEVKYGRKTDRNHANYR